MARYAYLADARTPLAFAHRGAALGEHENTMGAFAEAVAAGFRYLETDVQATADGVAVVFHDATLARVLGRAGRVGDLRWADLAAVRRGGAVVVPKLVDVLEAWPQVRFNIDVKTDTAVSPVVGVVRRTATLPRVLLTSFRDARTARMRAALGPDLATSPGVAGVTRLFAASRISAGAGRLARRIAAAQVPTRAGRVTVPDERLIRYAHRWGVQVHVWTVNDAAQMHRLLDLGVDGIMTDRVDVLRDVYTARGLWPPERP